MSTHGRAPGAARGGPRQAVLTAGVAAGTIALAFVAGVVLARLGSTDNQLKAVLLGIACVGIAAAAVWPRFGFALLIPLLPFQYHAKAAGLEIGTNELLLIGLAVVLAPRIVWTAIPKWTLGGGVALAVGALASVVPAVDQGAAAWGAVRLAAVVTLLFAAFGVFRGDERVQRRFVDVVCAAGALVVGFAILQRLGIYAVAGSPYYVELPDSTFGYYTVYAGFVAMVATLAIGELLTAINRGQPGRTVVYGGAVALYVVGIGVSLSRGGLLALSAGLVALLILQIPKGSTAVKLAVVLVAVAGIGFAATPKDARTRFRQRFEQQRNGPQRDDIIRFAYQKAGRKVLTHSPLGIGYGNFSGYVGRNALNANTKGQAFHSHNLFVQIGVEDGWVGLAGFLLLVSVPLLRALRLSGRRLLSPRSAAFAAALVGMLAQGLFDYLFHEIAMLAFFGALIWGLAGLLERDRAGGGTLAAASPAGGRPTS